MASSREELLKLMLTEAEGCERDDLAQRLRMQVSQVESLLSNLGRHGLVFQFNQRWYHGCFISLLDGRKKKTLKPSHLDRLMKEHKRLKRVVKINALPEKRSRLKMLIPVVNEDTKKIIEEVIDDLDRINVESLGLHARPI